MTLKIGSKAPDFTLPATGNKSIKLSDLLGTPVILYFYPKDDTPGCTQEACDFRDSISRLKKSGVAVFGVSKDSVESHEKFSDKFSLNFPLLSDEDGKVIEAYGVWAEKSMFGKKYMGIERTTFLIDTDGKIARVWNKVKVEGHVDEIIDAVNALASAKKVA